VEWPGNDQKLDKTEERKALQMQPHCPTAKGRLQFLFFFRQRRSKILFRPDPRPEAVCSEEDDLIRAEGVDKASLDSQIENARSRLGWGITHI